MTSSMRSSAPSKTIVSGLSTSAYGAVVRSSAMLFAMQKPEFQPRRSSSTSGKSSRIVSAVPSVLALSTTWTAIGPIVSG